MVGDDSTYLICDSTFPIVNIVFLSRATPNALPIRKIEFSFPAQAALQAYENRFGLIPLFDSTRNCTEFDAAILDWPLLTRDEYMHGILDRIVRAELGAGKIPATVPASHIENARREILKIFLLGSTPSIEAVAQKFGCSIKILRDRLARESKTVRHLLDEVRRDLASEHLSRGKSVTETAYLLGFSEPSAFQHASKRWFGMSPGELRKNLMKTSIKKA